MDDVIIRFLKKPICQDAVLIEGLPGIGEVGKIAATHLIEHLDSTEVAKIYSPLFPPQVIVSEEGLIQPMLHKLYHTKSTSGRDLLILTGDYQALTGKAQYELSHEMLGLAKSLNVVEIITLGGYGVREIMKEPRVLGAATSHEIVEKMEKYDVQFNTEHPTGGIVGASGLLLGLAPLFNLEGMCLMGETHGSIPDPLGAKRLVEVLTRYLDLKIDLTELDESAKQLEEIRKKLMEMTGESEQEKNENLNYFV